MPSATFRQPSSESAAEQAGGQDRLALKVLRRLAAGYTYQQIAGAEYISPRTVRRIVSQLKRRTGTKTVAALCAEAARRRWIG